MRGIVVRSVAGLAAAGLIGASAVAAPVEGVSPAGTRLAQAAPRPQGAPPPAQPPARAPSGQPPVAEAQSAPPQPTRVETVKHDNWTVTCQDFAEGRVRRSCAAQLQVVQAGSNQVLFAWTIGQDAEGRLVNVVQTLPGVLIAPGIELKLGKAGSRKLPFVSCEPNRCTATLPADEGFVKDASAAETAEAVVYGTNGRGVQFGIPLKGIDKAFAAARAK